MNFIDRFVVRYIKRNFDHGAKHKRDMILQAVTDSMRSTFNEDNLVTRYSALTQWMLQNDSEFKKIVEANPDFPVTLGQVLREAAEKFEE